MSQAALGLVLPTLLVWRLQVDFARQWAAQQAAAGCDPSSELQRSAYARLCGPALAAAGAFGWPFTLLLVAGAAFVAALLRSPALW